MASKTNTPSLKGEIYLHLEILKAENVDDVRFLCLDFV